MSAATVGPLEEAPLPWLDAPLPPEPPEPLPFEPLPPEPLLPLADGDGALPLADGDGALPLADGVGALPLGVEGEPPPLEPESMADFTLCPDSAQFCVKSVTTFVNEERRKMKMANPPLIPV